MNASLACVQGHVYLHALHLRESKFYITQEGFSYPTLPRSLGVLLPDWLQSLVQSLAGILDRHAVGVRAEGSGRRAGVGNGVGAGFTDVDLRDWDVKFPARNLTTKQTPSVQGVNQVFIYTAHNNPTVDEFVMQIRNPSCAPKYLLHLSVDSLTHLRPAVTHQNRPVFVDVDQSCSLSHTNTQ